MLIALETLLRAIPALEEADKVISEASNFDPIMLAQTDTFFSLGLKNPELMASGFKAFKTITSAFNTDIKMIVDGFIKGHYSSNVAFQKWKALTGTRYQELFMAGTKAISNPFYKTLGLTKKDLAFINSARRAEGRYFKKFLVDIKNPKHLPAGKIPRDAFGKRLPGYRVQQHDYLTRAGFYSESGKSQFFNGMTAGAGSQMEIVWRLGTPQTTHCQICPIFAKKTYTWKTLPATPGDGTTPCLFKCYCTLDFRKRSASKTIDIAGTGSFTNFQRSGRFGKVYDSAGREMSGEIQQTVDDLYSRMYKARQMMEVTSGPEKMKWIQERRRWNRMLIEQTTDKGLTAMPSVSVKDLVATIKSAAGKGGEYALPTSIAVGDELVFVRSDYSSIGTVFMKDNYLWYKSPEGVEVMVEAETDILFKLFRFKEAIKVGGGE